MDVPLSILLYVYLAVVGIVVIVTAVNLYHLWRFGYFSGGILIMGIAAVAIPAFIVIVTFGALAEVDWSSSAALTLPSITPSISNINPSTTIPGANALQLP